MDDATIRSELMRALAGGVACYHEGNGLRACANPCRSCTAGALVPVVRRLAEVCAYEAFEGMRQRSGLHGREFDDYGPGIGAGGGAA